MKNKIDIKHKVLFIGDIHGLSEWDNIALAGLKQFYEIVFLGDYVDSFFVRPVEQLANLKNLCTFIRKNKQHKVTALLGNHDYAYVYNYPYITGHQATQAHEYRKIFQDNIDLFQIAWGYQSHATNKYTLATHAGLTQTFWNKHVLPEITNPETNSYKLIADEEAGTDPSLDIMDSKQPRALMIHEKLNFLQDKELLWKVGQMRGGWGTPGPLWTDYMELLEDPYEGINQVFGHTPKASVTVDHNGEYFLACVDSWGNKKVVSLMLPL
jgi:predicted MPP superfamily phosphohydrolase